MLYDDRARARAVANVERVARDFTWERVMNALVEFCRNPVRAADKAPVPASGVLRPSALGQSAGARRSRNYAGWRRDVDRVRYYLKNGGPTAVLERFRARRERQREAGAAAAR